MTLLNFFLSTLLGSLFLYLFMKMDTPRLRDVPNHRSMHDKPTKKSGGFFFFAAFWILFPALYLQKEIDGYTFLFFLLGSLFFAILGFLDDLYNLSSVLKLILELLFLFPVLYFFHPEAYFLGIHLSTGHFFTLLFLSLILHFTINLANFMDGLDFYLSGSFFIFFINLFFLTDSLHSGFGLTFLLLLFSMLPFLFYNYPNASLFLGDSGSLGLGFFIATSLFFSKIDGLTGDLFYLPLLLPAFWIDGLFTLLRRTLARKNILSAHREHLYQRIQQSGYFSKKQALFHFSLINLLPSPLFFLLSLFFENLPYLVRACLTGLPPIVYYLILHHKNKKSIHLKDSSG
ncbi:MAG: sugar phosphotransferase [Leptospiraceae bacterium]|nr:sugar phosphotransferase [Leptospiraceae bacterium]